MPIDTEQGVIEICYKSYTIYLKIIVIFLLLLLLYICIKQEFFDPQDCQYVKVTEENTRTYNGKIERMHEMATFPIRIVRWHIVYWGCIMGSFVSWLLLVNKRWSAFSTWMIVLVPTFFAIHISTNFHNCHSPCKNHVEHANRLKMDLLH